MKQSAIPVILLLFALAVSPGFRCEREFEPLPILHEFAEKFNLSPERKIYSLADTVWVSFPSADKKLFDKLANGRVPADSAYLHFVFHYSKLSPADTTLINCKPVVTSGFLNSFSGSGASVNYVGVQTRCEAGTYALRVGFVPLQKGVFLLEPHSSFANCPNRRVVGSSTLQFSFSVADANSDLLQQLVLPAATKTELEQKLNNKTAFVFKVE